MIYTVCFFLYFASVNRLDNCHSGGGGAQGHSEIKSAGNISLTVEVYST